MDTLIKPKRTAASAGDAAWDEAFLRVESYLRAHHIESRIRLNELTTRFIAKARERAAQEPDRSPVSLAIEVTNAEIGAWFATVFGEGDWADERFRARGRLALLLAGFGEEWSNHFLQPEGLSQEFIDAMRRYSLEPGPEVRFTNMPPTLLDADAIEEPRPAPAAPARALVNDTSSAA